MSHDPPRTGAVLAGGTSSRLGRDKRLVQVGGETLVGRTARVLDEVCDEVAVVCPEERFPGQPLAPGLPTVTDERPDTGPAAGIEAALRAATGDVVIIAACDHPMLTAPVLELLAATVERSPDVQVATLPAPDGRSPLLLAVRRSALPEVSALLDDGERRVGAVVGALRGVEVSAEELAAADRTGVVHRDVDVPTDLETVGAGGAGVAGAVADDADHPGEAVEVVGTVERSPQPATGDGPEGRT